MGIVGGENEEGALKTSFVPQMGENLLCPRKSLGTGKNLKAGRNFSSGKLQAFEGGLCRARSRNLHKWRGKKRGGAGSRVLLVCFR